MMKRLLDWLTPQNPWIVMLPFLALYIALAATLTKHDVLVRDEVRYWGLASNLLHGHFHNLEGDNFLWSGPGYPALLAPMVALDVPYWVPKVVNAGIYYLAMVFFFKLICLYLPRRSAWVASLCMLFYYVPWEETFGDIMTEALAFLLTIATSYSFCKALLEDKLSWRSMLKPAAWLAWLTLTKVIFGYVVLVCMLVFGLASLIQRKNAKLKASFRFTTLAMVLCLPYLVYTYSVSGKLFYWGNAGGMQLYWMSSPYEDELGDWHYKSLKDDASLMQHHGAFFASIDTLEPVEKDDAFK
ncbi:MAG: ArnT family glycosyltransferase, partial [Flavobacteriales bacterium]